MAIRRSIALLAPVALLALALPLSGQVPLRGTEPPPARPGGPPRWGEVPLRPATPERPDPELGPRLRCEGRLDFGTLLLPASPEASGPARALVAVDPAPGDGARGSVPTLGGRPARCWVEGDAPALQVVPLRAALEPLGGGAVLTLEIWVSEPEPGPLGTAFWVGGILEVPLGPGALPAGRYQGRVVLLVTE